MNPAMRLSLPAMLALALVLGCGGDGPTGNRGVVQLYDIRVSPQTITCGLTPNPPPREIAAPDTVLLQVHVINTTPDTISVLTTGVYGIVVRASDATDVSRVLINSASLPFTPIPNVIRSKDGDVTLRVSIPMDPVCQAKPNGYLGTADVNVSARVTATTGQYVSDFYTIHVEWR